MKNQYLGTFNILGILSKASNQSIQYSPNLFIFSCTIGGSPPRNAMAVLIIEITDINNNPPVFTETDYEVFIEENQPGGIFVTQVRICIVLIQWWE